MELFNIFVPSIAISGNTATSLNWILTSDVLVNLMHTKYGKGGGKSENEHIGIKFQGLCKFFGHQIKEVLD